MGSIDGMDGLELTADDEREFNLLVRGKVNEVGSDVGSMEDIVNRAREALLRSEIRPTAERWTVINKTTILVNLDAVLLGPFDGAKLKSHEGPGGWVIAERRGKDLYVDGHKAIHYLSKRQRNGKSITGLDLMGELKGKPVQSGNLLDALFENQGLIPESMKKDSKGNPRLNYFWADLFEFDGNICVRNLNFRSGKWYKGATMIGSEFRGRSPAVMLEGVPWKE